MPKLTALCPVCGKQLKLKEEHIFDTARLFEYTCGHFFTADVTRVDKNSLDFDSADLSGKKARHYQEDGIQFIIEHDFNAIIGDQMRLGKTPQALLALKNKYKDRTPCLIVVKPANLWQWIREFKVWTDTLPNGVFPIVGSKSWIPPGFSAYVISMDTFGRPAVQKSLKAIPFKLVIVDEAHSFKDPSSNRSQALVDFISYLNTGESPTLLDFTCVRCGEKWEEHGKQKYDKRIGHTVVSKSSKCPKCGQYCYQQQQHDSLDAKWTANPEARTRVNKLLELANPDNNSNEHERSAALAKAEELKQEYNLKIEEESKPCGLILLTGTPILNRADEYFVPLNLVNPERFSSLERFRKTWLEQDAKGRWSRVKPFMLEAFKTEVGKYLLRREKEDVFTDLPKIQRNFTLIEPDKGKLADYYNSILDQIELKLAEKIEPSYFDVQEHLMKLRRVCGMMKVSYATDFLETCALDSASKWAVGIHHESVRDVMYHQLGSEKNCYKLSGEDNSDRKDWVMRNWETSNRQFLIINMLAGGVGMDFHYCDNVLVLERQWNSEVEAQFEFRFYNPDLAIKKNPTNIEYVICKGLFDEWMFDLIESKRKVVGETVYNNWNLEADSSSLRDLLERTVSARA